jgi:hypothetical protein
MSSGDEPQRQINQLLDGLSIEPPNRQEFIHNVVTGGDQGTRRNYDLFPRRDELELKCNQLPGFLPGRLPETQA